ncbi:MAG: hypothetical protein HY326_12950 [Chloroflexi bacterium]|nr:hypothetical protein [Chloroflexota bacterium]
MRYLRLLPWLVISILTLVSGGLSSPGRGSSVPQAEAQATPYPQLYLPHVGRFLPPPTITDLRLSLEPGGLALPSYTDPDYGRPLFIVPAGTEVVYIDFSYASAYPLDFRVKVYSPRGDPLLDMASAYPVTYPANALYGRSIQLRYPGGPFPDFSQYDNGRYLVNFYWDASLTISHQFYFKTNVPTPTMTATMTGNPSSTATATATSSVTSTPTVATVTPTATLCPQATPEPLWVEPVTSPTNELNQRVIVRIGNGEAVTVTTESGVFAVFGNFSTSGPALVDIALLPNTIHHLRVEARVKLSHWGGCLYGGYTLSTITDRLGAPLTIVQQSVGGTATPTVTPTGTPITGGAGPALPHPTSTPAAPVVGDNLVCQQFGTTELCAWVSEARPQRYTWVTVYARVLENGVPQPDISVNTFWTYRRSWTYCNGITDEDGISRCMQTIYPATSGYRVNIDVTAGGHTVTTWFIPR